MNARVSRVMRSSGLIGLGLAASFALGCKKDEAPAAGTPGTSAVAQVEAPKLVRTAKAEARPWSRSIEITGSLDPDERSEVAAVAAGAVRTVSVDVGDRVRYAQPIVQLDQQDAKLRVAAAEAALAQAVAELRYLIGPNEKGDFDESELERTKRLFANGSVPLSLYGQVQTRAAQAQQGVLGAQAQLDLAKRALANTTVHAPFDGAVVEKRIAPGEFAAPGRVVAVIVRDNPLRLRFDIAESDLSLVTKGQKVAIEVAAHPGRLFEGQIDRIGASLKPQTRTLPVEAAVKNDAGELKSGLFARASISVGAEAVASLAVPESALSSAGGSVRVFVKKGDKVEERLVTAGRRRDGWVEVRGALQPGEDVVIHGSELLSDGALVAQEGG